MSDHDDAAHDDDEIDRRAILSRRAKLLSLALAGIALAAVAPSNNPVCAQHNVPGEPPVRMRIRTDATSADATETSVQDDSLPDLDQLPEETIDAGLTVSPRPQVCLSPPRVCLSNRIDEPVNSGCGCRRNDPSSGSSA